MNEPMRSHRSYGSTGVIDCSFRASDDDHSIDRFGACSIAWTKNLSTPMCNWFGTRMYVQNSQELFSLLARFVEHEYIRRSAAVGAFVCFQNTNIYSENLLTIFFFFAYEDNTFVFEQWLTATKPQYTRLIVSEWTELLIKYIQYILCCLENASPETQLTNEPLLTRMRWVKIQRKQQKHSLRWVEQRWVDWVPLSAFFLSRCLVENWQIALFDVPFSSIQLRLRWVVEAKVVIR